MTRLEAKHHNINLYASFGRAAQAPALIAQIRRRMNPDLRAPFFRDHLDEYLARYGELVPSNFRSFTDLLQQVYGHGLAQCHPDLQSARDKFARQSALDRVSDIWCLTVVIVVVFVVSRSNS
jgi:hypothetical protein